MDKIDFKKLLQIQTGGCGAQIHTDHEVRLMLKEALKQGIHIVLKEAADKAKIQEDDIPVGIGYKIDKQSILSLEEVLIKQLTT